MSTSEPQSYVLQARVFGRVQGVGFRYFVQRSALELGLAGWVQNESDGSVHVWAEGARDALADLAAELHNGPRLARVDEVVLDQQPGTPTCSDFVIRR